jgi:hypothetical protein
MAKNHRGKPDSTEQTVRDGESSPPNRKVLCKYHATITKGSPGRIRTETDNKSKCPSWTSDLSIHQILIDEALEDSRGNKDAFGRPCVLWNAIEKMIFVARSCNMEEPFYSCYPDNPPDGKLLRTLKARAKRSCDEVRRQGRE